MSLVGVEVVGVVVLVVGGVDGEVQSAGAVAEYGKAVVEGFGGFLLAF